MFFTRKLLTSQQMLEITAHRKVDHTAFSQSVQQNLDAWRQLPQHEFDSAARLASFEPLLETTRTSFQYLPNVRELFVSTPSGQSASFTFDIYAVASLWIFLQEHVLLQGDEVYRICKSLADNYAELSNFRQLSQVIERFDLSSSAFFQQVQANLNAWLTLDSVTFRLFARLAQLEPVADLVNFRPCYLDRSRELRFQFYQDAVASPLENSEVIPVDLDALKSYKSFLSDALASDFPETQFVATLQERLAISAPSLDLSSLQAVRPFSETSSETPATDNAPVTVNVSALFYHFRSQKGGKHHVSA